VWKRRQGIIAIFGKRRESAHCADSLCFSKQAASRQQAGSKQAGCYRDFEFVGQTSCLTKILIIFLFFSAKGCN